MQAHTKSTFFVLAFIGLGIILWWWIPDTEQPSAADRVNDRSLPAEDTNVNEPLPDAQEPPQPPVREDRNDTVAAPTLQVTQERAGIVQAEIVATKATGNANATCGPTAYGEIVWGDGESETVYGLGCSAAQQTLEISHEYARPGDYTITFTDQQQVSATHSITIAGEEDEVDQIDWQVSQTDQAVTVTVTGVVDPSGPVAVDGPIVFGDLSWGDGTETRISGLSGQASSPVTHEYATSGTYTLSLELRSGTVISREVVVD